MIIFSITFPTQEMEDQTIQELSDQYGYDEMVYDDRGNLIPNPENRLDFAKRSVAKGFSDIVRSRVITKGGEAIAAQYDAEFAQVVIG